MANLFEIFNVRSVLASKKEKNLLEGCSTSFLTFYVARAAHEMFGIKTSIRVHESCW